MTDPINKNSILLVEDNPVNQDIGREMLEYLGYDVTVVANGLEALDQMESNFFSAVLMDCRMPGMDGYEATKILRQREQALQRAGHTRHQTIIALTAYTSEEDRELCMASGMDDYLAKPYSMEHLAIVLDRRSSHQISIEGTQFPAESVVRESSPSWNSCTVSVAFSAETPDDAGNTPSIDDRCIANIRKIDPSGEKQVLQTVIRHYLNNTSSVISAIHKAADDNNMEELFRKAHYLKSGSANLGATRLVKLCNTLELVGKHSITLEGREIISRIESEYSTVAKMLMDLLPPEMP